MGATRFNSRWRHRAERGRFAPAADLETARLQRLRDELAATTPFGYPTSGDPDIIGEHEVAPVRCSHCNGIVPWKIIKGWRD